MKKIPNHYSTIQGVIAHIIENKLHGSSLDEIAKSLGMSSGYLQKVFTEWVGISPKQFSRYLSLQYSKELLSQNKSALQATVASGLSSGGRLHDLFVDIEAMTPGEFQRMGSDVSINYSIFETKFGLCLVASTDRGICNILFSDNEDNLVTDLRSRWSKATIKESVKSEHKDIKEYFLNISEEKRKLSKIKFHLNGTNFQVKVWEALLSIPEGSIMTYGDIATLMGDKNLSRAVGAAIGDNPIGYIIPCHRVLKSSGEISGYRWGVERKRAMLGFEAIQKNG